MSQCLTILMNSFGKICSHVSTGTCIHIECVIMSMSHIITECGLIYVLPVLRHSPQCQVKSCPPKHDLGWINCPGWMAANGTGRPQHMMLYISSSRITAASACALFSLYIGPLAYIWVEWNHLTHYKFHSCEVVLSAKGGSTCALHNWMFNRWCSQQLLG